MNHLIIIGIVGATLTFYVSEQLKQGAVRASALLSLLVALFFYYFPEVTNDYLTQNIPIVFIGASFIGMVSSKALKSYSLLAVAGSLFSIIYFNKSHFFDGYGGALGILAFIALLATMRMSVLFSENTKATNLFSRIKKWIFNKKK